MMEANCATRPFMIFSEIARLDTIKNFLAGTMLHNNSAILTP
jgi:hypothetical protein